MPSLTATPRLPGLHLWLNVHGILSQDLVRDHDSDVRADGLHPNAHRSQRKCPAGATTVWARIHLFGAVVALVLARASGISSSSYSVTAPSCVKVVDAVLDESSPCYEAAIYALQMNGNTSVDANTASLV